MFRFLLLALCLALTAAFTAPASALRGSRSSIVMSGPNAQKPGKAGNPLWGYTVGSRAPDAAISSGTTQSEEAEWKKTFLGGLFAKKPAPPPKTKGSRMKRPGTI
eukprot:CAMPEP_0196688336 /NCGR_PEP_ID=MMETSP1090-20130531/16107_1 /TAXON_ID=37098 /ORGANISM="Isochrysis sp, Strain CCMP1244" /LENGTH=104 /DNA_ID=CAMNT_0042027219 /DNA_START=11 /DNA_END=325 /DNA_ORIENTATION=+